jgi:UDP-glucose 4-epimerase
LLSPRSAGNSILGRKDAFMKALITGGAGFIGSHLCDALLDRGDEVHVIDDLSTGAIENIDHLRDRPLFHYTIDSIMNQSLLAETVDRCDVVFHLAAAVGVKLIVESPVRTIETNVRGTEVVLHHASKKKKRVILASTSEVYGKGIRIPFREDDDMVLGPTTKGRWSYACSKALDEFLAIAYWREKNTPVVVVRLFNTVGPRQTGRYGMVVPSFVRQALVGEPITVYGDGSQSRCFAHVADVVEAIVQLAEHPGTSGEVFNIGNPHEITILELAELVKRKTGTTSAIVRIPYDQAYEAGFEDMQRRVPDISKIRSLIGFQPARSLDDILTDVIRDVAERIRPQDLAAPFSASHGAAPAPSTSRARRS